MSKSNVLNNIESPTSVSCSCSCQFRIQFTSLIVKKQTESGLAAIVDITDRISHCHWAAAGLHRACSIDVSRLSLASTIFKYTDLNRIQVTSVHRWRHRANPTHIGQPAITHRFLFCVMSTFLIYLLLFTSYNVL